MAAGVAKRRVVVTGLGVVSCCGIGTDAFFDGLSRAGDPRASAASPTSTRARYFEPKEARQTDRFAQFSVAAAAAWRSTTPGELGTDPLRTGVIFGTGVGGLETLQEQITRPRREGARGGSRRASSR